MSEPIKQHYVPRSYLKNFAECNKKKKCFVDVYYKRDDVIRQNIDTKTICYQKHLYTLQSEDDKNKYDLELYYANNVDAEFQNIYRLLIDKKRSILSKEEKLKILYVCLSFYFRTPIHLNHSNSFTDDLFERLKLLADDEGIIKTSMFGGDKVNVEELDEIKQKSKEDAKTKFDIEHLQKWFDFVQHKYECTINVIEIQDKGAYLITSDNPVMIREYRTNQFCGLFNPNNVITMPLDSKHFLEIHPNTVANEEYEIQRLTHDTDFVFTTNAMTEQNADNLLIGKKNTIDFHFKLKEKYEDAENGQKFLDKAKFKVESLQTFFNIVREKGIKSGESVKQLKKMSSHEHFKNDKQIEGLINLFKNSGIW